jgi:hypothetical protein
MGTTNVASRGRSCGAVAHTSHRREVARNVMGVGACVRACVRGARLFVALRVRTLARVCALARVRVCARAHARVAVCVCARACVGEWGVVGGWVGGP